MKIEKLALAGIIGMAVIVGALGVKMFSTNSADAQTATPAATVAPAATDSPSNGAFKSNEDPAHEAKESAAREAQENAGQRPTVP